MVNLFAPEDLFDEDIGGNIQSQNLPVSVLEVIGTHHAGKYPKALTKLLPKLEGWRGQVDHID